MEFLEATMTMHGGTVILASLQRADTCGGASALERIGLLRMRMTSGVLCAFGYFLCFLEFSPCACIGVT
jgi:hypothetical protein